LQRELNRLLHEWRMAEQRWERVPAGDPEALTARDAVLRGWLAYNAAAGTFAEHDIVLLADDAMTCVSAFGPTVTVLQYEPDALVGRHVVELTPPDLREQMESTWRALIEAGRVEGETALARADGTPIMTRFTARAHHPLPGLHYSRFRLNGSR
jgi:PAS domain-containing protein